ncbi:hypothetical protein HPB52_000726 [Rhipicephalus sanguineus]|uniref:Endonuclease/exonuclease/phosphatase domain-containing protein n=1 Tax=Rhipicephalus sanguineus TaxID=34632 RepID=A0A9D4QHJ2_RHISA|nr:hypothetical protein HPB52_000726 [Rhipicephalus sanguineus]
MRLEAQSVKSQPGNTDQQSHLKKSQRKKRRTTGKVHPSTRTYDCAGGGSQQSPPIEAKEGDKWDGTESPRSCRNSQSCPPMGTQKEVVLVGDKNIEIVAEIVVAELGSPTALKCISGRSATAADAIAYATKYDKEAEARTRQPWTIPSTGKRGNKNHDAMSRQKPMQRAPWTSTSELGTDTTSAVEPREAWAREQDRSGARKTGPAHREDPREGALQEMAHSVNDVQGSGGAVRRRPRHPKAQQRRRRVQHQNPGRISIAFLNLHGGRRLVKWEELYIGMEEEGITLYGVAETHLRDLERPPVNPLWNWAGCNRESTARGGGGVGFLWREGSTWTPIDSCCAEHTWMVGHVHATPVLACVVYLSVAPNQHSENTNIVHCIRQDIERWGQGHEVLILGDFNGAPGARRGGANAISALVEIFRTVATAAADALQ